MMPPLGRRIGETLHYGQGEDAITVTLAAGYTPNGQKASQHWPVAGLRLGYEYDAGGRLARVIAPGGDLVYAAWQWQRPTRIDLPGATRTTSYDGQQRVETIQVTASSGLLMDVGYRYDLAGNPTERRTGEGSTTYAHDALNRLTEALPPPALRRSEANPSGLPVERYSYDGVHNRIDSDHQPGPWSYDANNRLLTRGEGDAALASQYDQNGQTTRETQGEQLTAYTYNAAERLSEITRNNATIARYRYDPFGRRIGKEIDGQTTWYVYSDEGLLAELDGQGHAQRLYGWEPNQLWGTAPLLQLDRNGDTWTAAYLHTDPLGTPQRASGAEGALLWAMRSEAFGRTVPRGSKQI